ncbi:MAG: TldD/PmbA family protein [Candidatus Micrarchaeota archaeon]
MGYSHLLSGYSYAELRIEKGSESFVGIKDEEVRHSTGAMEGMSARVLIDGSWGFASGSKGIKAEDLFRRAERLARLEKGRIKVAEPKGLRKTIDEKVEPADSERQVKALLEAGRAMKADRVTSRIISCTDSIIRSEYYNSQGAEIIQETGATYMSCSCVARSGDMIQRGSERDWSRTGFKDIDPIKAAHEARDMALRLLGAIAPPKGRFTAVFDPEMTGVFSHEAVGHACEADSVVDKESVLSERLGKRIGDDLVTIIDDPTADDFGRYAFDDEGVEAKPVTLVDKGVLRGFLNSRETAFSLGMEPNGHARAEDYGSVPAVRMANTYFQKGGSSLDEVFDVQDGVYLKGMKGGSVDIFSGGFMFKAEEAYEIKGGELGRLMRDATLTGNILETLLDVECVGNDFGTSPGVCGKSAQQVPVSDGGPHIRVKNVVIG